MVIGTQVDKIIKCVHFPYEGTLAKLGDRNDMTHIYYDVESAMLTSLIPIRPPKNTAGKTPNMSILYSGVALDGRIIQCPI